MRRKLVETGDVDVMIAVRSNFFYTRTVPCELWFLNRAKPERHRDKMLMIDARNVYRKLTRKIYDFSPEQQQNLQAIVWLYRGERTVFSISCPGTWGTWRTKDWPASSGRTTTARRSGRCQ